jgi:filamentous hemagglutinin family protein
MRRILSGNTSEAPRKGTANSLGRSLALAPFSVLLSGMALASPQGGQVVGGAGTIAQPTSTQTIVNQQTEKMVINWPSFNMDVGDVIRFYQPSSSATVLNRILDQNPSQIFGSIQANGRVFLANPNGLIFGESATINVGSFLATTLNTSITDFMLNGPLTLGGADLAAGGAIVNHGLIAAATGGSVTLVGGSVLNEGTIIATLGSVNLASGKVATLDFDGDGLLSFAVSGEVLENTASTASAVANTGSITADGGQVLLTGHAAKDVFAKVVNNEGIIQANSIDTSGGTIRLVGGDSGIVVNSGTLQAKGDDSGEKGGTVHMLGEKVGLIDSGKVDVSGDAGGGTALIGGDYQGKNSAIRNASATYVGPSATIDASAMGIGDGGKVIVWADDTTRFYGSIVGRGGALGGDGGFAEVSGKQNLTYAGLADLGATFGNTGSVLLDPEDLYIGIDPGLGTEITPGPDFSVGPGDPDGFVIATSSLTGNANYTLSAANNVIFNDDVTFGATGGANNVNITAGNNINSYSFKIQTYGGALTFNAATMSLGSFDTAGGLLSINNSGNAGLFGDYSGTGGLTKTGAGTLTLSGANTYTGATTISVGTLTLGADEVLANGSSVVVNGGTLAIGSYSDTVLGVQLSAGAITGSTGILTSSTDFDLQAGSVSAILGGSVGVDKSGGGSVTLSGANTYTGATTISAGTLTLGANNVLADGSSSVVNGGTLAMGSYSDTVLGVHLSAGAITGSTGILTSSTDFDLQAGSVSAILGGSQGVDKSGGGSVTLSGANTYTGDTIISAGTLTLGANNVLADGSSVVVNGGTLAMGSYNDTVQGVQLTSGSITGSTGTLTSSTDFDLQAGSVSAILGGSAGVDKSGGGSVTLSGANTYTGDTTISAGTLALGADDVLANGSSVVVNGGTLAMGSYSDTVQGVQLFGGAITGSTGILTSATDFDLQAGSVSAILGGSQGVDKSGGGSVTLSGANTYTGDTTISAGTLALGANNVLANGSSVVVNDGTLAMGSYSDTVQGVQLTSGSITGSTGTLTSSTDFDLQAGSVSAILGGSAGVDKSGSGNVTLSGANTYTGATTINAGTLQAGSTSALGSGSAVSLVNVANTFLDLNGYSLSIGSLAGGGTNGGNITNISATTDATLTVGNTSSTQFDGTITEGAHKTALTKTGSGTLTLSGANTYTGATTISAGTLTLGANNVLADGSSVVVNGGTLAMGSYSDTVQGVQLTSGNITGSTGILTSSTDFDLQAGSVSAILGGSAGVDKSGGGSVTLSGANTYTGATTISAGTLTLGANNVLADGSSVVVNGGTLAMGSYNDTVQGVQLTSGSITGSTGILTNSTDFDLQAGSVSAILGGSVGVDKSGGGSVTLSGTNTYTGATTISAGTLTLGANNVLADGSSVVVNGGTLAMGSYNDTVQGVQLTSGSITGSTGILTNSTDFDLQAGSVSAILGGSVGVDKSGGGSVTLSGTNTYTGATTISAGTLTLGANNVLADGSSVVVNGGTLAMGSYSDTVQGVQLTSGNITGSTGILTSSTDFDLQAGSVSAILGGSAGVDKSGGGSVTLSGTNSYTGTTTISDGTLVLDTTGTIAASSGVTNSGTLSIAANKTIDSITGYGTVALGANTLTIGDASNTDATYAGVIFGTGGITKAGTGTLTLSGANTYSGGTTISAGTLVAANGAALGSDAGTTTIGSGAVLSIDSINTTEDVLINSGGTLAFKGSSSSVDDVNFSGIGSLDYTDYTGAVSINLATTTATGIDTIDGLGNMQTIMGNGLPTSIVTGFNGGGSWTILGANTARYVDGSAYTTLTPLQISGFSALHGGSGTDTLTGRDVANNWLVNNATGASIDGVTATGMEIIMGGSLNDTFTLAAGVDYTGNINGGGGTNTLAATNGNNTWNINGADQGTLNGKAFTNIANLQGGSGDDTFVFANAGTLSGDLAGGTQTSMDTLDLQAKIGTVTINQQTQKATGIVGIFTEIEKIIGNGSGTTLTGSNSGQTFTLTGANAGTAGSLAFSGVANLIGGSGNDTYTGNGGSLSGTITDGAFNGDKTAFVEGGDGGSTTISGSLNVAGLYLNSTTLHINGDINAGSGTVYLRTVTGDIDNISSGPGHTLNTSGDLHLITSSLTGTVSLNIAGNPDLYLNTWQPSTLNGQYTLAENINGVSIINSLFDALVGSEFGVHDSIDYFIDPALFDQQITLFTMSDQTIKLPDDQLEETLGKYYRWPAMKLATLTWSPEATGMPPFPHRLSVE